MLLARMLISGIYDKISRDAESKIIFFKSLYPIICFTYYLLSKISILITDISVQYQIFEG